MLRACCDKHKLRYNVFFLIEGFLFYIVISLMTRYWFDTRT